ncbi:MAG: hypothetical protein EHM21_03960, partial [Chloroflexi bacterium]
MSPKLIGCAQDKICYNLDAQPNPKEGFRLAGLLSVYEAQQRIFSIFRPVDTETVPVDKCSGRILAEDIYAPGDLPPFANSSMDGFAVRAGDVQTAAPGSPVILAVVTDIPAGTPSDAVLQPGQAARIMTGAPLPAGADAVVPVEDTVVRSTQVQSTEVQGTDQPATFSSSADNAAAPQIQILRSVK